MFEKIRKAMVENQLSYRGIKDPRVIAAFLEVERHLFVREEEIEFAYNDYPLPIGSGQTISQPYIVAYMMEKLKIEKDDIVLEVGTGSGYEAALISKIAKQVITLEVDSHLYSESKKKLKQLGYKNIEVLKKNGFEGYEKKAPYDAIIVSAAPVEIPKILMEQLKIGGRMILPLGGFSQQLIYIERNDTDKFSVTGLIYVRFVPMIK
ncbi:MULTISPECIES: protein-L-isoaspartate(D-aspartate) O-methyltransferase [Psychrilyobacter]|uniref:Protein-L-isoaspartate O-methyltransferase n=1 Tax=Psychrilyobacter piezotolerans TaxID=2293438 RepID=A0ABX9KEA8_9FUSO|nr:MULTISPECIES: protein-L-isoaspartate(D-aspartate) O-methyltransferase [Psychrilyobacter]MCS5421669.1 protein-L-isoaspartate(D-aspartate) O-methyltransferase [Psychrilyobacter sp. S5]NDI78827.1 protein-L-isoaspartate(D-aspartate) O-methyltransferase [Psychrilyobacter piezotolerans]RDE59533.1 protein-L-isoaspartate(D-aspartate) O-methyltransferase [Psychrilyobacter sp. S5]REI39973.1 protein-L-isoaspartate(D-aspartate) O-methyltransferase [Psychrilyobacter piezotolerans]